MAKTLIQHIAGTLKSYPSKVFLVENNDGFLYRKDVKNALNALGVEVSNGTRIKQRIKFEMREKDGLLILLCQDNSDYLEDIKQQATVIEFSLNRFIEGYHIPSIIELDLNTLDKLKYAEPLHNLNRRETLEIVRKLQDAPEQTTEQALSTAEFKDELNTLLDDEIINWSVVCRHIAKAVLRSIGKPEFKDIYESIHHANTLFQDDLQSNYQQIKQSSPVKRPKIVSKILDYLDFNYRDNKIALIVVDGMTYWQYELLSRHLPQTKDESVIYSWLPSITQLSRQAIFRGDTPTPEYRQAPINEEKLWRNYWKSKGLHDFEIEYQHEKVKSDIPESIKRYGIVLKGLDDKMHGSTDYNDLKVLSENWIERSNIASMVQNILDKGFKVFLTTDHGNIQATGWRGLKGREKLGTNKSGSRSERHIEYSEKWLRDDFLANNPDLNGSLAMDKQAMYFTSDLSFSKEISLVTHGGAHLLEVLIPFIELKNES